MKMTRLLGTCAALLLSVGTAGAHEIAIDGPALTVDDGLLLGNGSLSASCFQTPDGVTFRFGRNDVWDRRVDYAANPKPPTHDEFVRGILDEGWTCRSWTSQDARATKGAKDERRFLEICQGTPPAVKARPYPCPKPTGELRLNLPIDFKDYPRWRQRLEIEEGRLTVEASWTNGVRVAIEAAIAPEDDVFAVRWNVTGWTDDLAPGKGEHRRPPVWCELVRASDTQGLPPPKSFQVDARRAAVEQAFPVEATFPNGFAARLVLSAPSAGLGEVRCLLNPAFAGAGVRWLPKGWNRVTGEVLVTARTTSDGSLDAPKPPSFEEIRLAARKSAAEFWAKSAVRIPGDRFLEDLWYATGHARRCVLGRKGSVPPGLFFPSTIGDAPNWHGDWHSNFNYQSMFWGDFAADRLEEAESYFAGAERFFEAGRLIASKYYGMRGFCAPLQGFPIKPTDDYAGAVPLGRMVYQTGWLVTHYLEYYRYTLDRAWLAKTGYPILREAALFYLDFLKKAPSPDLPPELRDGKYHAFPSIEEETRITGVKDVLDRPQVLANVRHALWAAAQMADVLDVDAELRRQWRDRLDNLVGAPQGLSPYETYCYYANAPEFGFGGQPYRTPSDWTGTVRHATHHNSFGHSIRGRLAALRQNRFIPGRDFAEYREILEQRRRPNGLVRAMVAANWGRYGWTESLSAMAPMQEMMLQSWDGAIRLFPYWPKERDADFSRFRAQGAFIVSASWRSGRIGRFEVQSEKGADCHVHGRWRVFDAADGAEVGTDFDPFGRLRFKTMAGRAYRLEKDACANAMVADDIDPMIGTVTYPESKAALRGQEVCHGFGKTFPGATTPFGMVQLSPDTVTGGDNGPGYSYTHKTIEGFSFTHMSGIGWYGEFGNLQVMPSDLDKSRFSHSEERAEAGYYRVRLADAEVVAEATAARRSGMLRFTYEKAGEGVIRLDLARRIGELARVKRFGGQRFAMTGPDTFAGEIVCDHRDGGWGRGAGGVDYTLRFAGRLSRAPEKVALSGGASNCVVRMSFPVKVGERIVLHVALSFDTLPAAPSDLDFDAMRRAARTRWVEALSGVAVEGGTEKERTIFATALYHAFIDPREIGAGELNGHRFVRRTVFSGWDVFRSAFPLYTLLRPDVVSDTINSMMETVTSGRRDTLPRWDIFGCPSGCMIGQPLVSVMADAWEKGIRTFDAHLALALARKSLEKEGNDRRLGYTPGRLSKTLEFAYGDWCCGRLAEMLGERESAARYFAYAQAYTNCWSAEVRWMRARTADGGWLPWKGRETDGQGCVEANPWQQGWFVPHDPEGLIRLMGGRARFTAELDAFFSVVPDDFRWNPAYNHPNEPCHTLPFLWALSDRSEEVSKWTHRILAGAYGLGPYGLCGNEDVGQMSAWYVLASIGLHPLCPGDGRWYVTAPVFRKATIRLDPKYHPGGTFAIRAPNAGPGVWRIAGLRLNGKPLARRWVSTREVSTGGVLDIDLCP